MTDENSTLKLELAVDSIVAAACERMLNSTSPILVALDGGSGAGKSTLAVLITKVLDATLIQSDDFYAAEISDAEWDRRTAQERAADAIDWQRLRSDALEPLLAGKTAKWHPFDIAAQRPDGTYAMSTDFVERQPASIIILDGAYSSRPELADLIRLSVLVDVSIEVRHKRLNAREDKDFLVAWHARWDGAEAYYFTHVRPKSAFELVVTL